MTSENLLIINESNFEQVKSENEYLLLDFWADWCNPCRMLLPIMDSVAAELKGKVAVGKINVDQCEQLALNYGILSIPAVFLLKNGNVVGKFVGTRTKNEIIEFVNKYTA